ncbi:MAG: molybdate ABC transporter substrate-binding protein [Cutibacterium granulosum]|nr:molybdate ABC transporter substrate-binding protein [Cutibacterium granulosum]MEA5660032.1 molybdate ABC transporter substrate-binding protein [Cutibacterium granulosum]MEA5661694.1 molybdate ABC transporter substrate-binding protein [Cutibacterium granulosum]
MIRVRAFLASVAAAAMTVSTTACGGGSPSSDPSADRTRLTVFAAASLTKSYEQIGEQFERTHPGVDVQFSFEGSQDLVAQLAQGAPVDVLATADTRSMTKASDQELVGPSREFATNVPTLITPAGNPAKVTGLDSSLVGADLVICAAEVPCGSATSILARKLGVTLAPVSEEQKVTDVRGKVESGQADAGIVYRTDAKAAGNKVEIVPINRAGEVVNHYPIAVAANAPHEALANEFIDHVMSDEAQKVLADDGFSPAR